MSKEFEEWKQKVGVESDKFTMRNCFAAGRALGRREMRGEAIQAACQVFCHPVFSSSYGMGYDNCKRDTLDAIEAIPEEV